MSAEQAGAERAPDLRRRLADLSPAQRAELEARLRRRTPPPANARAGGEIPRRPEGAGPLSPGQQRLWFLHQLDPGDASYNMCFADRLRGPLDVRMLRRAIADVVDRHASLRTRFADGEAGPVQIVEDVAPAIEVVDLTEERDPERRVAAEVAARTNRPFDLAAVALPRVSLFRLAADEHVLCVAVHHIVSDGLSLEVFRRELAAAYRGESPPRPGVRYGDYAAWQRERLDGTAASHDSLAHWRTALAGVPVLELPTDRPRPPVKTTDGSFVSRRLPAGLSEGVQRLARDQSCSPFMVLLAVYNVLLACHTGQRDFAVGTPIAGRNHPDVESLIGFFVNTLVLRADLSGDPAFTDLLARTKTTALRGYAEQEVPFDRLVTELGVERDLSRTPLFQTMFSLNVPGAEDLGLEGVVSEPFDTGFERAKFELSVECRQDARGLTVLIGYNTGLFDRPTAERLAERFERLLTSVVAEPWRRLSALSPLSPSERDTLLNRWNPPAPVGRAGTTLHGLIEDQVTRTPDAVALVAEGESLTYGELNRRADRLAAVLHRHGVGPESRVGVCLERGPDVAVALLAVLKAGGAYLPLDPEYPAARLTDTLGDAGARVLIADVGLPGYPGPVVAPRATTAVPGEPVAAAGPANLAYVIYTSGSTGRPKGVAVQHWQILNYLADVTERFDVRPGAEFALPQSLTFDFGITMLYLALTTGGRLHMLPTRITGAELAARLTARPVDFLKITPSHLAALAADTDAAGLLPRRTLILGGEASEPRWAHELAALAGCEVVNHYGPTEATVGVTTWDVGSGAMIPGTSLPVGRPLGHARIYVLDECLQLVPPGAVGEICIGGDRLARGYLGRPGLTAERFTADPYGAPGARLYRTGDLGRWLPGGDLEFLGRRDLQVKIRGYRVELGEVEAALGRIEGVGQAVAAVHDGDLVAYLTGTARGVGELRRTLGGMLPDYMIPTRYVWLDRFPLKAHGKVDRSALPAPAPGDAMAGTGYVAPETPVEECVAKVWADVLGLERVGALDDFFDLGGHSLLATRVVARLRGVLPDGARPASVMDLFQHPTVRGLAEVVERAEPVSGLLYDLTPDLTPLAAERLVSYVCVPYGGGSAVAYQPLADALPPGHALYAVAMPGHDLGLDEPVQPMEEVARRCVQEILERVEGPLVLYGHCGVGGALIVEIARRLEAAGRSLQAVYIGGLFPFSRPGGPLSRLFRLERLRSDRVHLNWLKSLGADLAGLDDAQLRFIVGAMRHDARAAEDYFTSLMRTAPATLTAPIISVVGERDPGTEYYRERYREWHFLSEVTALVVLDEGGHYFLKYRAEELASILTSVHATVAQDTAATAAAATASAATASAATEPACVVPPTGAGSASADADAPRATSPDGATWWLDRTSRVGGVDTPERMAGASARPDPPARAGVRPSMPRFLAIALGQMVSISGSSITEYAIPVWIYLTTGSLPRFAFFVLLAMVPGVLVAPLAGAVVDRADRRTVLIASDCAAGGVQLILGLLVWTDGLRTWHLYALVACLSVALTFQRLAYASAVPQLVPKRYLGHANGLVQMATGVAQFVAPLAAVGFLSAVGLGGILVIDVASFCLVVVLMLLVRFPAALPHTRRESLGREIVNGFRYTLGKPAFRAMLAYFALFNVVLSPLLLVISPLVLSFGSLATAGRVAFAGGLGAAVGGLVLALWGGPGHRRMRGVLLASLALAGFAVLASARPAAEVVGVAAFGMYFWLAIMNGIYATIVVVKVPQRFHGRVFSLNQMIAWSTLPLGFGVIAPLADRFLEPLLAPGGALSPTVGRLIGVGDGRGLAFMYIVLGLTMALIALAAMRVRTLARFDDEVPDAMPDDLVGLAALRAR